VCLLFKKGKKIEIYVYKILFLITTPVVFLIQRMDIEAFAYILHRKEVHIRRR